MEQGYVADFHQLSENAAFSELVPGGYILGIMIPSEKTYCGVISKLDFSSFVSVY